MAGTAIVRRPSPLLAEGIVTHVERTGVDAGRAREQWEGYVAALREHGWRIVEAPAADDHPDGVFVEDAAVVLRGIAVLTRSGAPERRGEVESVGETLADLGHEPRRITAPAVLDGGDVMAAGDTVYVGLGGRTNAEGARQLGEALEPAGMTVVPVPLSKVLHLKSAATVLPDGTVIGDPGALDDPAVFPSFRGRSRGGRSARRPAGRRRGPDGHGGAPHRGAARAARPTPGRRRDRRVREARGLRDLPVGPRPSGRSGVAPPAGRSAVAPPGQTVRCPGAARSRRPRWTHPLLTSTPLTNARTLRPVIFSTASRN